MKTGYLLRQGGDFTTAKTKTSKTLPPKGNEEKKKKRERERSKIVGKR